LYPGVVILQAAIGAGTTWLAWALGCELFNRRAGLFAAALTAINPYAILHDTALQDTSVGNALLAFAIYQLLLGRSRDSTLASAGGGLALAAAALTTARTVLLPPLALVWAAVTGEGVKRRRLHSLVVGLAMFVPLGGWIARNSHITGSPLLTTEAGLSLWS